MRRPRRDRQAGFSMLELLVVIAIVLVMMASALFQVMPALQNARVESGFQMALAQVRRARQRAIDERRIYRLSFVVPRTIQLDLVTIDPGGNRTYTFVESIAIANELQFATVPGIPTGSNNTPDGLGTGSAAIDFGADYGGGQTTVFFQPDGRALDSANRVNSGVLYIARPGDLMSSRAVSVLGGTGRIKGWHLVRSNGSLGWRQ